MISLIESKPVKLSGTSSFLVFFQFNPKVINALKTLPIALWHANLKAWEISKKDLAQAIDTLVFLDDINLVLLPETDDLQKSTTKLTLEEIAGFKYKPYDHQIAGINFLLSRDTSLLLDAPGVGKSLEMMYYAETLHKRGLIEHCIIITGIAALRQQWKTEIQKFSNESVIVLGEKINKKGKISYKTISERAEQLKNKIDEFFIIMNVENLREKQIRKAFEKTVNKIDLICFDEIHRGVVNKKSKSASGLLDLDTKYKVGATGSLIVNSPISAYMSLAWTGNDKATLTNFKSQYCIFGGFGDKEIIGYKNLDLLQEELETCGIRRTFDQVRSSMPKKTIDVETLELEPGHADFYDAIKEGVKEEADKIELNTKNLLALTIRLRQATSDPTILTTEPIMSTKIKRAAEIVEDLVEQGEKVIVMDVFKASIYSLAKILEQYNPLIVTGDISDSDANSNIEKFRNDPNAKILLGTSQKIGTGFSMPECHYLVFISTAWTYSEFNQNCERIYRITSDQPVFIKVLLAKNTIDERVWNIVNTKKELSDYLVDGQNNSISDALKREIAQIIQDL